MIWDGFWFIGASIICFGIRWEIQQLDKRRDRVERLGTKCFERESYQRFYKQSLATLLYLTVLSFVFGVYLVIRSFFSSISIH